MKYVFVVLLFCLVSCGDIFRKAKTTGNTAGNILEKQLKLPVHASWGIMGRDTAIIMPKGSKLVVYYKKQECSACSLRALKHWKPLIKQIASIQESGVSIEIVFVLNADKQDKDITEVIIEQDFQCPILFDESGEFERYNRLPENEFMNAFVLDAQNSVKLVGNPLIGYSHWKVFEGVIKRL